MNKYNIGDELICIKEFTVYKEPDKEQVIIQIGSKYKVLYAEYYNDSNYYELKALNPNNLNLSLWNDAGHEVIDNHFRVV